MAATFLCAIGLLLKMAENRRHPGIFQDISNQARGAGISLTCPVEKIRFSYIMFCHDKAGPVFLMGYLLIVYRILRDQTPEVQEVACGSSILCLQHPVNRYKTICTDLLRSYLIESISV